MKPSALLVAAAIAIVPGVAVAKDQHSAAKSKSQGYGYAYAPMDRSEAIQTCNAEAAKWSYRDFQSTQLTVYRDCMFRHGTVGRVVASNFCKTSRRVHQAG
jgi:hypothetical protein